MKEFSFISLGCAKNRVDSEVVIGELLKQDFRLVPDEKSPDIVIINTCAFLRDARLEALETIKQYTRAKKSRNNNLNKVVVIGCLAQYIKQYGGGQAELQEVDLAVPVDEMYRIPELLGKMASIPVRKAASGELNSAYKRFLTSSPHSVNIKITDGCINFCAYCLIPSIRGPLKSTKMEDVVAEVQAVEKLGAKEINLIGQDITMYGSDIYGKPSLVNLLERLLESLSTIQWIRLLYVHPARINNDLIDLIAKEPLICSYIDMPIQHINSRILSHMGRDTTREDLISIYERLRERIPGLALRTTVMTGYPGESEKDFFELLDFLRQYPFDRLGGFAFSPEKGTRAFLQSPKVKKETAEMRMNAVMKQQKYISKKLNRKLLGKSFPALIESYDSEQKRAYGRIYSQAPEVDGKIIIPNSKKLQHGEFASIKITGIGSYDFIGESIL